MNHRRARKLLNDYLEGELGLEERARLDAHLSGCDDCACEARELRQTVFLLRALPIEESPPGLAEVVMARIQAGDGRPPRWVGLMRRLSDSGGGLALAAGLAALLIVAIVDPVGIGPSTASSVGHPGAPELSLDPEPIFGQQVAETRPDAGTPTATFGAQTQTVRPLPLRVQTAAASRNPAHRSPTRPRGMFASPMLPRPSSDLEAPSVDDVLDALLKNPEPFVLRMQRSLRGDRERAVDVLAQRAAMRGDDREAVRKLDGVNQPNAPVLARLFESRAKAFRSRLR